MSYAIEKYVRTKCAGVVESKEKGKYPALTFTCPACHKAGHAQLRLSTGKWTCYKCQSGGDISTLIATVERVSRSRALSMLRNDDVLSGGTYGDLDRIDFETTQEDTDGVVTCGLPSDFQLIATHPYLESRLVSPEETQRHLFGVAENGKYRHRIVIPIMERGIVQGFLARDYTGTASRKVLNPPISSSAFVWNIDTAFDFSQIVVCEGVFSALRVGYDAVATLGKNFSDMQMDKLVEFNVRTIVLMFDSDVDLESTHIYLTQDDGTKKRVTNPMPRKLARLSSMFELRTVRLTQGDPGDHARAHLRHLVDHAPRYSRNLTLPTWI